MITHSQTYNRYLLGVCKWWLRWSAIASYLSVTPHPYATPRVRGQIYVSAMQTARYSSYLLNSIGRLNIAFLLGTPSVAGIARFELAAYGLGGRCSIHLSYIPIYLRRRNAGRHINEPNGSKSALAERKGFEPLALASHWFSRPAP